MLDKDVINKGDRLYDLMDGVVEVVDVRGDTIVCAKQTSSGRPALTQYSAQGVKARARVRTLYWHDPIVAHPRKDARVWTSQARLIKNMIGSFTDFVTSAVMRPELELSITQTGTSIQSAHNQGFLTGSETKELLAYVRQNDFDQDNKTLGDS